MAIFPSRPRIIDYIAWALLASALLFAVYVRVRLREFPLERDEGEFAYAGQLILNGVPPYKLAYNMKLPGTYLAYAALMAVFGQTTSGIHLGLLAVNMATIVLLYRFVRELFDPFSAGMAAIAYAILSESPAVLGMAAHATHFVAFFGLAGTYLLWRHLQAGRLPWVHGAWQAFASGLLLGIAFLMKQQGVFLMVFGGLAIVTHAVAVLASSHRQGSFSPRQMLHLTLQAVIYCVGAVLPYLLICLWLWRAGVWEKFWFWTVEYASKYVQNTPLSEAPSSFWMNSQGIVSTCWPLGLLALVGIPGVAIFGRGKPGARSFVFGFLAFCFFCVCPGFYFRQHYFIVMLPAVALLVGVGSRLLWDLASGRFWTVKEVAATANPAPAVRQKRGHSKPGKSAPPPAPAGGFGPLPALTALVLLAAVTGTLWIQGDFLFTWNPLQACRLTYMSNPFLEGPEIAKYLQKNTAPDDTIAVLGSEPEIFFDARRQSATGYIYTYGLVEEQPLALKMQKEMIAEIEAAKPKYVVFANVRCSWLTRPHSETEIFDWAANYLDGNYQVVGILEPQSPLETTCLWDEQLRRYRQPKDPREWLYWKLLPYPEAPKMQKYCMLPYITVWRRKS